MEKSSEYENQITSVYNNYFEKVGLDENSGLLKNTEHQQLWKRRFSTYPYIGTKYGEKKRILFLGMDVGFDTNEILTLSKRKSDIEEVFLDSKFLLSGRKHPNPHMLGTMLSTLHILNNEFWTKIKDCTRKDLKNYRDNLLKEDYTKYIALTNVYKYSSQGRKNLRGKQDRIFLSFVDDLELLKEEIVALKPEIVFLQGVEFSRDMQLKSFLKSFLTCEVYPGPHPSTQNIQTSGKLFECISQEKERWNQSEV